MGTVTYPDSRVAEYLQQHFFGARYDVKSTPEALAEFHAFWTPTLVFSDDEGVEVRRTEGYLEPAAMLAEMALARLRAALLHARFEEARTLARETAADAHGDREREAEALYFGAVADYKASHDPKQLTTGLRALRDSLPDTDWARRADI